MALFYFVQQRAKGWFCARRIFRWLLTETSGPVFHVVYITHYTFYLKHALYTHMLPITLPILRSVR
jgi:hypothetical protein